MAPPVESGGVVSLRAKMPEHFFRPDTKRSLHTFIRDVAVAILLGYAVVKGDGLVASYEGGAGTKWVLKTALWLTYWWFQGLNFTGIWVIGHECGHGAFSQSRKLSDFVGFLCHTFTWTPYFSWKYTHQSHHRHHASMEKDEHWIPKTRSELGLPAENINIAEFFEDTPIVNVFRLLIQQILGYHAYLVMNTSGQRYPTPTSHFNPYSTGIFKPSQRKHIMLSNFGICLMVYLVYVAGSLVGATRVWALYGIPSIAVCHWVTMIVFLQHTDPILPHYRKSAWSYRLGALSTMDRNFLGWQGKFFLHNIAHYHTVHHLFPAMPFYYIEEATEIVKRELGDEYHFSAENSFTSLWANFKSCQFVEDEGDILYYKDRQGMSVVENPKM